MTRSFGEEQLNFFRKPEIIRTHGETGRIEPKWEDLPVGSRETAGLYNSLMPCFQPQPQIIYCYIKRVCHFKIVFSVVRSIYFKSTFSYAILASYLINPIINQYSWICETIKFNPKQKKKLRTKYTLWGLQAEMFKNYCHICDQRPPVCQTAKFCTKIRILKFGTKNVYFQCFGAVLKSDYCPFCNQRPQICLIAKVGAETKILKFGIKNA